MGMQFDQVATATGFRLGVRGPLVAAVYRDVATLEALTLLDHHQGRLLQVHPKIFSFTLVVGDGLLMPPKEVREFSAGLQGKYAPLVTGAAIVIAARGLSAVVARSFLSAFSLIAPPQMLTKTFKDVSDAVIWAQAIPGQLPAITSVPAAQLSDALEQFMKA